MPIKRFQSKIAESRMSLPVTIVYAVVVLLACRIEEKQLWIQFGTIMLCTLLMVELNNRNALIRIYSRMVSCSFIVLTTMANFQFATLQPTMVQCCFAAFYVLLFHAYQDKQATGWVFYAFACIGTASTVFVHILFYVPLFWILMIFNIMSFSPKTFCASLLGLSIPYWFLCAYYLYVGDTTTLVNHWMELTRFQPLFDYSMITRQQAVTFVFIVLLALTGSIHFLRNSFRDKIRTRLLYELFMVVDTCSIVFLMLQPQHYDGLLPVIIINTAPLIGHYLALTRTKLTNISVFAIVIIALAITACNLWMPSLTF